MSLFDYFLLDNSEITDEPTLGGKPKNKVREKSRQKLVNTLLLYVAVVFGVVSQFLFAAFTQNGTQIYVGSWALKIVLALIVGGAIFPTIYRSAGFNRHSPRLIQYFIAFQNGFFWQALLQIISKQTN